jgi:hypothetical protein
VAVFRRLSGYAGSGDEMNPQEDPKPPLGIVEQQADVHECSSVGGTTFWRSGKKEKCPFCNPPRL